MPLSWQQDLRESIRDLPSLLEPLGLSAEQCGVSEAAAADFPVRVPRPFLARMEPGEPRDPLLLQVLALGEETHEVAGYTADPLEEAAANPVPGVIHKYHGRVLLMPTSGCAVHCRYCFRRHFPYEDNRWDRDASRAALDYIRDDCSIEEVILSGGDPLLLSDSQLQALCEQLDAIPHLKRLRIHSRTPVVIPARVSNELVNTLVTSRLRATLVVHCNHASEINGDLATAMRTLVTAGITVLNQSVLLRGINDSVKALAGLSERLFDAGVMPYYLHVLDPVAGAAHFNVGDDEAATLLTALQDVLPGYLVPKLAREVPGAAAKQILG